MSQKVIDFLSSVGMMVLGVSLIFFCSVTLTAEPVQNFVIHLPVAKVKPFTVGGDLPQPALPVSRPAVPVLQDKEAVYSGVLTASSAVVVDDMSNTVLFKKNADEVRSLASITKLMSALVLEDLSLTWASSTVITDEDADPSSHHLNSGERYTLGDLWQVALVGSSNSAIHALVRAAGLTDEQFAQKMNEKATALGLNSLHFVEPTGLDSRNMGTAIDILRLLKAALKVDHIAETLGTAEVYAEPLNKKVRHHVWTTDWLLSNWVPNTFDKDVLVGKTGYIDQSGYNFVVRVPGQKAHVLRVVVLGAASNESRFTEARDLAEWVFAHYIWPDDEGYAVLTSAH